MLPPLQTMFHRGNQDVIGAFKVGDKVFKAEPGAQKKWCNFYLHDLDEYSEQFLEHVKRTTSEYVIVIIQLARTNKRYGEQMGVSTSYNASKVLLDVNVPDIEEFRTRMLDMGSSQS
ncbi:unnamed protein product [Cuscuta europaea]|uniref:Uncharacterized protein n=1 Tax=Cuscuta europaea TaxID=41803 RepID=A0A9P0YKS4_CUSEU|nr:unnamed protein product [Cuscuta europaea]